MKFTILFFLCVCGIWATPLSPTEQDHKQLAAANRQFAAGVYKEIIKTEKGNLIFSPFSAETVLALLSAGANGPTHDELVSGLALPSSQNKIQKDFKEYLAKLKTDSDDIKLLSANKIYANNDVQLEAPFEKVAHDVYASGVENVDFSKNVEAAAIINNWVEQQTNNKIQNLIPVDSLNSDTALVLVNALYLSASWITPFQDYLTRPEKFWKSATDSVEVPIMSQIDYFNYYDNTELGVKFLEMPYAGASDLSMVIALPHEQEGLGALEHDVQKLLEPQPFARVRVDVKLPKFTVESEIQFNDILQALGIKKIFEAGVADLQGLSANRKNLYVSKVIQKAFIKVTETGVEAAAATAVIGVGSSAFIQGPTPPPPKIFHAVHPFSYLIKKDGVILFAGRVNIM